MKTFRSDGKRQPSRAAEFAAKHMAELQIFDAETLLQCCTDAAENIERRGRACLALGHLRHRPAIEVLLSLLAHEDLSIVFDAARGLAAMKSRRATRALMRIIRQSRREEVRNAVLNALGSLRDRRAEQLLRAIAVSRSESESTRCYAIQALMFAKLRKQTVDDLINSLIDASPLVSWAILTLLGGVANHRSIEAIRRCLSDQRVVSILPNEPTVASAAEAALSCLRDGSYCNCQ